MAAGRKTGGRRLGTPNRDKQTVCEVLEALNCDPVVGMALIADGKIPCRYCRGTGKMKYGRVDGELRFDPEGKEMACLNCFGNKVHPVDLSLSGKMYAELAKYVHPQKRSVEVSGAGGAQLEIRVRRIEG